jgi:hypothetical protein
MCQYFLNIGGTSEMGILNPSNIDHFLRVCIPFGVVAAPLTIYLANVFDRNIVFCSVFPDNEILKCGIWNNKGSANLYHIGAGTKTVQGFVNLTFL